MLTLPARRSVLSVVIAAALVLGLVGFVVLAVVSQRPVPVGLVDGHLRPCPATPNCACSEGADASVEPLAFTGEPEEAQARLLALLQDLPRVKVVRAEPLYVHAVFRSRLFRFADDVELRIDPAAKRIDVRSAARVGTSDFGANKKRVEELRARWNG